MSAKRPTAVTVATSTSRYDKPTQVTAPTDGVEGALQGGQGDSDDGRIELAHEGADADGGHSEPRGIRSFADDLGAPGLDEHAVPRPGPRPRRGPPRARCPSRHAAGSSPRVTTVLALMWRDEEPTSTS